jgi:hypothetical protein
MTRPATGNAARLYKKFERNQIKRTDKTAEETLQIS